MRLKNLLITKSIKLNTRVYKLFDYSIGKIIRLFQKSLTPSDSGSLIALFDQAGVRESAQYAIDNMQNCMVFGNRERLWSYCLNHVKLSVSEKSSLILEFGVWKGYSVNFFAKAIPGARIVGFDSFQGLEEDWTGTGASKGSFSNNNKIPAHEKNVTLIKGWFEDTLPEFHKKIYGEQISLLHIDVDTYKPTKYILNTISSNLSSGTIIVFDEYFGYGAWKSHEFKAFQEYVYEFKIKYEYLAFTNVQVAIKII